MPLIFWYIRYSKRYAVKSQNDHGGLVREAAYNLGPLTLTHTEKFCLYIGKTKNIQLLKKKT